MRDPRQHIAIIRNMEIANRPELPDGVGTLLVSRAPLTDDEAAALWRRWDGIELAGGEAQLFALAEQDFHGHGYLVSSTKSGVMWASRASLAIS